MIYDVEFYSSPDGDPITFESQVPFPLIGVGEIVSLQVPQAQAMGGEHWRVRERRFNITVARFRVRYYCSPDTNQPPAY